MSRLMVNIYIWGWPKWYKGHGTANLQASSPFGGDARSHARAACERRRKCEGCHSLPRECSQAMELLHAYEQFKGEWVNKHIYSLQCYLITFSVQSTFLYSGPRCLDSAGVVWLIFGGWKHCKELHKSRSLMWAQMYYYPGFTKTFWHKLKSYSTFKNILNLCSDLKLPVLLLYKIHFH